MITRSALAREVGKDRVTLWRWEQAGLIPSTSHPNSRRATYSPAQATAVRAFVRAGA